LDRELQLSPVAVPGTALGEVDTPALLLDLDVFERNLERMQSAADAAGVALRPHAKAHKTPAVALAQIARGAVGICCQKVSEALPFIAAGVRDIHVSNQPALSASGARTLLLARAAHHARMSVCVDDAQQIDALGAAAAAEGSRIGVFVEIDIGQGRCGVPGADGVLRLLERLAAHPRLEFRGLQAYHGGLQHLRAHDARRAQSQRAAERAGAVVTALERHGVRCPTVTGGGTGSVEFDLPSGVFTEVQPGSYAFMDRDYGDNEYDASPGALRFDHALFLATTVMSTAAGGHVVVDAGLKSLATDSGLPGIWRADDLRYDQANDEHGIVTAKAGGKSLPMLGERLHLVPGHCDPTFNLHDALVGFRGVTVECVWPIAARGLSR
jgi:D-serine deaminase-like pyridoxal phosphate-dependent protein